MERNFGFKKSEIDGSEIVFGLPDRKGNLPMNYSYKKFLPSVIDQGEYSICVPCSVSAYINWKENLYDGSKRDNKINYFQIYESRTNSGEGMTFKDAFKFLKNNGVETKNGTKKISKYAIITDIQALKYAIVMNGPCVGALPVYTSEADFWNKNGSHSFLGYHAISIVGYGKDGFIIRNSWGPMFGNKGYTTIPYEDMNKFIEIWTIIE